MSKKFFVGVAAALALFVGAQSASAAYFHTSTLKMGQTSSQVKALQETLNMTSCKVSLTGAGSIGLESMYFGAKTKAAVQCYQTSNGLTADGVVGPMTGAKLAMIAGTPSGVGNLPAGCTSTSGFSPVSGVRCDSGTTTSAPSPSGLNGGAGSVDEYSLVSSLNNEEVGEDSDNVKVAGLEIEADDSSDLRLTAVKISFVNVTGGATSDDFEDVADNVSVWFGDTKVADVDADEFNDDNDFSQTLSLAAGAVIRAGETGELVVAVSGVSNLDSDDEGADWSVDFDSVRWVDAQGAVVTDPESTINTAARTFSFETFSTANDVELSLALNGDEDDVNESHTITVDDSDQTDGVSILAFTLESEGDSDVTINEIPVLLTTSTADIGNVVASVTLYHGSEEIGSEDIDGGATTELVTFDDLDLEIGAGDEEEFWVKVDLLGSDEFLTAGTTIKAEIDVDTIDAEDESGEELEAGDLTGSAVGDAHGLYETGITVTSGSESASANSGSESADDAYGVFTIKFSVTAVGQDVYLDKIFAEASSLTGSSQVLVLNAAGNTVTGASNLSSTDNDAEELSASFKIDEGETADFTLSVASDVNPDSYVRAVMYNLSWGNSNGVPTANNYSFDMGVDGQYKTESVLVQD